MNELAIGLVLILISGFLAGESENILMYRFVKNWSIKPMFSGNWYIVGKHNYSNKIIDFMMRYPLSFLKSGFHLTKSLSIVLFIIGISLLGLDVWMNVLLAYIILGVGFNVGYHT